MSKKAKNIKEDIVKDVLPGVNTYSDYNPTGATTYKGENVDKLHKQPRGYLKTTAKLVGKATDEKTLFTLPDVKVEAGGNLLREVISRNTAILGNYLLQLWQQNGGGKLVLS